ncbi:MAG: hypothetical protein JW855_05190 [Gammaproteobacteria bacterium]|nr:hypothetical protein [Gammaproteobacteria bacterium]
MMHRTTIMLPDETKREAIRLAHYEGISLGQLIRKLLNIRIKQVQHSASNVSQDPFFADQNYFSGEAPSNLSVQHDDYLYGALE